MRRRPAKFICPPGCTPSAWHFFRPKAAHELEVSYEGPGLRRQRIPSSVLTATEKPIPGEEPFQVDAAMAAKGRDAFISVGCASCHQLTDSPAEQVHRLKAPAFADLRARLRLPE